MKDFSLTTIVCSLTLVALATTDTALAKGKKKMGGPTLVAVEKFSGPGGDKVRSATVKAIESKDGYKVVSAGELKAAMKKAKVKKLKSDSDYQRVSEKAGIGAFVSGQGQRKGRKWGAKLKVRNGANGQVVSSPGWTAATMSEVEQKIENDFWDKAGDGIGSSAAGMAVAENQEKRVETQQEPKAEENTTVAETQEKEETAPAPESSPAAEPEAKPAESEGPKELVLDAYLGVGMFLRTVSYKDVVRGAPEDYPLIVWPSAMAQLDFYPLALATKGALARLGFYGSYEMSLGAQSEKNGVKYPTSFSSYGVGLKYRLPVGAHDVLISGGYGSTNFAVKAADATNPKPDLPDAEYKHIRGGLGARFNFGRFSLTPQLAYLHLLSLGQLSDADYYPNATGAGVEGRLDIGVGLTQALEVRLVSRYQRYFFALNPEVNDARVAGGMLDQYLDTTLGLAFRWSKGP